LSWPTQPGIRLELITSVHAKTDVETARMLTLELVDRLSQVEFRS
jgi:hypothetical protein